jgi:hypothetical protein
MQTHIDHAARNMDLSILSIMLLVLLGTLVYAFRKGRKFSPLLVIGSYYVILITLFMVGLLQEYGYGWGFFPLVIATLPSYFLVAILPEGVMSHWLASGLLGNFVLIVVICGGLNSLAFYLIATLARQSPNQPDKLAGQTRP